MFQRFMSLSSFFELLNKSKTFTLAFVFAFGVSACADMDSIYSEVADDAVAQYNMTKRHGDL
ncbi:MAG: hypothetical protein M1356_07750, partial [Gammaproteobacteria bacterium]|nr:hypothetical protein [Gammaproteobacteria bacterium]